MMLANGIFTGLCVVMITAAILAVALKNVFYNALSLILCLFCVAGIFIFLNSEFLAVIEVIIYIGAISIAIIFAIMLSQTMQKESEPRSKEKVARSVMAAVALGLGIWKVISSTRFAQTSTEGDYSLKTVGHALMTQAVLPFEAVSVVLLIAIIGALVISGDKS